MAVHSSRWGAKIGPRLAILISQAVLYTHLRMAKLKHNVGMSIFHGMSDEISEEVDVTLGPLIKRIYDMIDEEHPHWGAINFLHTQHGQLKAITGSGLQVSGLLGSISAIMNNELLPVVYDLVRSNPHSIPPVQDAATFAATGIIGTGELNGIANANGFDNGWAAAYLQSAYAFPSVDQGIDFIHRGQLNLQGLDELLLRNGVPQQYWDAFKSTATTPVSVADAALGVLRGTLSQAEGEAIAAENGFTPASFQIFVNNTGEPPGTEQLLEAFRRGFINQETLRKGILQSRVRDEWIPTLEQLRYSPISVADAVNAVVQNQLSESDGESIAQQNGLEPGQFTTLRNTAGEPLSRTEMEELYNRGLVTQSQVEQALRESRLKNKYNTYAFELHTKLVPVRSLGAAVQHGTITHADAIKKAMEQGYSAEDSAILVASGSSAKLQAYKDRVIASMIALYEDNLASKAQLTGTVSAMGYDATEVEFVYQAAEFHRVAKLTNQVVGVIKSKYLARHIERNEAVGDLDALGIPAAQRDNLMGLWDIEHSAYTRVLSEAQIAKAVKIKLLTPQQGLDRLVQFGYSADDAVLLIEGA
jgi:hypothetical protein